MPAAGCLQTGALTWSQHPGPSIKHCFCRLGLTTDLLPVNWQYLTTLVVYSLPYATATFSSMLAWLEHVHVCIVA